MRLPVLALLASGVAACAPTAQSQERLALACEVKKCRCVIQAASMFAIARYAPVQWKPDGSASCAEGQYLEFEEKPKPQ